MNPFNNFKMIPYLCVVRVKITQTTATIGLFICERDHYQSNRK